MVKRQIGSMLRIFFSFSRDARTQREEEKPVRY